MNQEELKQLRQNLEKEKALILEELKGISTEFVKGDFHGKTEDIGSSMEDAAQEAEGLDRNQAIVAALRRRLEEIEDAIAKIDAGEYGKCKACLTEIHPARLKAMPVAVFCVSCAEKRQV